MCVQPDSALTLSSLCFSLRIHSKEHFKEKYAVDDVQYADEVSGGHMGLCAHVRWIPLLLLPQASGSDHMQETDLSQLCLCWVCTCFPRGPGLHIRVLLQTCVA